MIDLWTVKTSLEAFVKRTDEAGGFDSIDDGLMQVLIWLKDHAPKTLRVSNKYVCGSPRIEYIFGDARRYTNTIMFDLHIPVRTRIMKLDHTTAPT